MRKLIIMALMVVAGSTLFTSCLKDTPYIDYTNIAPIVIVPNGNWPKASAVALNTLDWSNTAATPVEVKLYAHVSSDKTFDHDVEVTFALDPAAITAYNTAIKPAVNWSALDPAAYTMSTMKTTIKAGETDATISIMIDPSKVDNTKHNMLSFSIVSAGGDNFSSNFKTYLYPLLVKNRFDGTYTVTPFATPGLTDVSNASYSAFTTRDYHLATLTPDKNVMYDANADALAYTHSYNKGTTATPITGSYANFAPVFQFDYLNGYLLDATKPTVFTYKVLGVTNYYTAAGSPTAKLDATGTSAQQYITITSTSSKAMSIKYNMVVGATTQATFNEKWAYKAARP